MKKITTFITTLVILAFFAATSTRADVVWQELFNYTNGEIIVTSTNVVDGMMVTNWSRHSGTGDDAIVNNQRLENSATVTGGSLNGPRVSRQDDVHRDFPAAYTNPPTILYASFVVNCTNMPSAAGTYFAHFYISSTNFQGRLFALVGTNLCLPNTYRLGVAGAATDPSVIFPNDLAMNQDYQVVFKWDPVNDYASTLWVNPISSSDLNLESSDTISGTPPASQAFAFRQASSFGNWFCTISNVVVATTFDEASTNVWASNSVPPSIAYDLTPSTNFVGSPVSLSVVAAGQGLADFVYQWQKDGANIPNPAGNANVFTIAAAVLTNTGTYDVIVSNMANGAFATSSAVLTWVTNGPPFITVQPTNQAVYPGKTVTVSVTSLGTPTLAYSWLYNGGAPTGANVNPATTNTSSLVVSNIQSANGTLGGYNCFISNAYGGTNSFTNTLTLLTPQVVNIDFLHGQVDPTFFLPTNTTLYYTVTNAVVYTREVTNGDGSVNGGPFTGPANGEFYIQDDTGGICVFVSGGTTTQPRQGDIVNVTGPLSQFNSLLEFNLKASDPSTTVTVIGHTNTLPAPVVLPFTFTNGSGEFISVSNVIRHYEGRLVTLTNVYFRATDAGNNFASGTYTITNLNGDRFSFFLNAANANIIGRPIPAFALTVTGPMGFFLSATATNRSGGFEIDPSSYSDILVSAPVTAIAISGGGPVISWNAQPYLGYSILWSTNVLGPYTALVSQLGFTNTAGTFTDSAHTGLPIGFYRLSSP